MISILTLAIALSVLVKSSFSNKTEEKWRSNLGIIHGVPALDGEYPSIVSIQENGFHLCGGNIINEFTILTAAHCTIDKNTDLWDAVAGTTNIEKPGPHEQKSKIISVIVHPKFEIHSSLFDIAIARVSTGFVFNPFVNQINLHSSSDTPEKADIVGWGATTESGPTSSVLLKTTIAVETKEECIEEFGEEIEFGLICAKTNHGDACLGDSGGPMVCNFNELCGIISSGDGCGHENYSALYTEVSYFVEWIEGLLSEETLLEFTSSENYINNSSPV
ncbi:trypsin-1 [Halyomorpha halys]|uniref:trypsin-1 n=1 Tax=Halyomorpha halys TaxID=286706 RepID=UPI0006D51443|nr:trypsin-1-like [Halyomorpha halys]